MLVYKCDLCDEIKDCLQKEIDGKIYDICLDCWKPLEKKLAGKGRPPKRETVELPFPRVHKEDEEEKPAPEKPPEIWYHSGRPN